MNPKYFVAYNDRGKAYALKRDYNRAIADFSEAIKFDPIYVEAHNNRGMAYKALGRESEGPCQFPESAVHRSCGSDRTRRAARARRLSARCSSYRAGRIHWLFRVHTVKRQTNRLSNPDTLEQCSGPSSARGCLRFDSGFGRNRSHKSRAGGDPMLAVRWDKRRKKRQPKHQAAWISRGAQNPTHPLRALRHFPRRRSACARPLQCLAGRVHADLEQGRKRPPAMPHRLAKEAAHWRAVHSACESVSDGQRKHAAAQPPGAKPAGVRRHAAGKSTRRIPQHARIGRSSRSPRSQPSSCGY